MAALHAQPDRIASSIDRARSVTLHGHVHPLATPSNDDGPVEPSFAVTGTTLHLKPSASQQRALEQLLEEQRNPASPNFRKWLTPEEYADRFGVSRGDIARIDAWLESQGFTTGHVARGRSWVVFSGTAEHVRNAFHTAVHRYRLGAELHYANASAPSIPAALQHIVSGVDGLHDFVPKNDMTTVTGTHYLAPDDLATIYDIKPLYQAGIDGTGQTIAIVGASSVDLADIRTFRARFNLPDLTPQLIVVPDLGDPGRNSAFQEADLDLEWSGAVARNATIIYVYSRSAFNAIAYAIDQNLAPVVSASFSGCEALNSSILVSFRAMAQQANAQGITWVNSTGDSGAAACDANGSAIAQNGTAVRFPASIPEVTGVGGTELDDQDGNYWNASNDANGASAISYIPEKVWNESATRHALVAGGGGASRFYPKPMWQSGPGVPDDNYRDVPDLALSASTHDGYYSYSGGSVVVFGGTSASTPTFAGMLALINHYLVSKGGQPGLGNVNPMLYRLAGIQGVFHDITNGGNVVPCSAGSPNCTAGTLGYNAGPGYDQATGLGSPDLANMVLQWSSAAAGPVVAVSFDRNPVYRQAPDASGFNWAVKITLTEEAGVGSILTGLTANGQSLDIGSLFSSGTIPPNSSISATLGYQTLTVPATVTLAFTGVDAGGRQWSQQFPLQFLGPPPAPELVGASNAASGQQAYAPGMVLSVYGSQLGSTTQSAAAIPLLNYMGTLSANVNGFSAPFYFVSPGQVNLQIPYEVQPGAATLSISNGLLSSRLSLQVAPSAPGIFMDANSATVPFASGSRGQVLFLYITGEGQVTPSVATGSTPPPSIFPKPRLPVSMTVGGVDAPIQFIGIPNGLAGVTQINFTVPPAAPLGMQPVVVTVGTVSSAAANFTVTP